MRFSNNESEKNHIFGFEKKMEETIFFSQNCLVTLVITASFEFWFLVRSQLAPRFLRESFLLNSKLILNQNPDTQTLVHKRTLYKTYILQNVHVYKKVLTVGPFHFI